MVHLLTSQQKLRRKFNLVGGRALEMNGGCGDDTGKGRAQHTLVMVRAEAGGFGPQGP